MSICIKIRNIIYNLLTFFNNDDIGPFILCYHSISNESKWKHSIDINTFKDQINYLVNNYEILKIEDLDRILSGDPTYDPKPSFLVTFDDGYKDIMCIKDFLKGKGIKPILFLLATPKNRNYIELGNELDILELEDIYNLILDGWIIGSHGLTHDDFHNLSKDNLVEEIYKSKKFLENTLKIPINSFSYPKGKYNNDTKELIKMAGYTYGFSMDDGNINCLTNPLCIPRIGIDKTHNFTQFKNTTKKSVINFRKYLKIHAQYLLRKFVYDRK